MNPQPPLYNSRITKTYVQYLHKYHPRVDVAAILAKAGIADYQIEDPAHWFSQEQMDSFYENVVAATGDPKIARKAGRYAALSPGLGAAKQYALGLMHPTAIYLLMEKLYPLLSRGARISATKKTSHSVEVTSIPTPDVKEKPYQCENRLGYFEALARWFTSDYAKIDHPTCLHRGDDSCHYVIAWEKTKPLIWKRLRSLSLLLGIPAIAVLFFLLPLYAWTLAGLVVALVVAALSYWVENREKIALTKTIETQKAAAEETLTESKIRYDNALLIQEIGQATAKILNINVLMQEVVGILEKRLDFDRGMIMLADRQKTRLIYSAGYGHNAAQQELLQQTEFSLKNPDSKGLFVVAMKERKPFLIEDIRQIEHTLSRKSQDFAKKLGSRALICAPIIYEQEPLGILAVDNSKSKRPLRQSDVSLLVGIGSQLAISIMNARSFRELRENEKKYRELVETANSIILRMDARGKITFINAFAQQFFGYTPAETIGENGAALMMAQNTTSRSSFQQFIRSLQQHPEKVVVTENEALRRNGDRVWITWTHKPIYDDEGRFREILCIGNDTTELKRVDQEKKDLQVKLQRAQKMEAIGTLAGGVAHDLNNILSGIVSYPELLLMDLEEDSPLRKPILTIQKSGEKAAAIVQDLLTLARRGVATTEVVNLNSIVSEYLLSPEYAQLALNHPGVELEKRFDPNLLNILGSPVHLFKTVMNLVANAAEAMNEGGKIIIATENRHEDLPKTGFDEISKGDYVTLTVEDTGIGISTADIERIFEPFYTKKAMGRSGTGLGMAVVWGTVKDHRGHIDIQSTEGRGTVITLYFPATRQESIQQADLIDLEDLKGRGESILVIDDVKEQRDIASGMLEKLGYRVTTIASGEEAVAYMRHGSADLMVLDMIMEPGIDGLETYKRILAIHSGQKAIIASGYSESARVKEAQRLGAGAYVKKPYLLEKIGRAVKAELDRNAAVG